MSRITTANPKDDYSLEIHLDNGHIVIYNMKQRLKTIRFSKLSNHQVFQTFHIENENTLVWDNLCQITIDEIFCSIER